MLPERQRRGRGCLLGPHAGANVSEANFENYFYYKPNNTSNIRYTCGHEPDSIEFSSLGGWISTRASGMKKNRCPYYKLIHSFIFILFQDTVTSKIFSFMSTWLPQRVSFIASARFVLDWRLLNKYVNYRFPESLPGPIFRKLFWGLKGHWEL